MNIHIPEALIAFVVQGCMWAVYILVFLLISNQILRSFIYAVKNRGAYWCAVAYLTTKKQQSRANEYTLHQFRQLAEKLRAENPMFLDKIKSVFESADCEPITNEWLLSVGFKPVESDMGTKYDDHMELGNINIWEFNGTGEWIHSQAGDSIKVRTRGQLKMLVKLCGEELCE